MHNLRVIASTLRSEGADWNSPKQLKILSSIRYNLDSHRFTDLDELHIEHSVDLGSNLNPGGCFFNIEPVAPSNEEMEAWYRERRERQYRRRGDQQPPQAEHAILQHHHFESEEAFQALQRHYRAETEATNLALLREAGFVRVDCFYKKLLESVIGGYKPR